MADRVDLMLRRMFVVMVLFTTVAVGLGTFYPLETKLFLAQLIEWVFDTFPVGAIIVYGVLAAAAVIILGLGLMTFTKVRRWVRRLRLRYAQH